MHVLTKLLLENQDLNYQLFSKKLIPDTKRSIIGVRVPFIKKIAKYASNTEINLFIKESHNYYEEIFLHGILLNKLSPDINVVLEKLDEFIPQIDNWAVCDSTVSSLKIFKKDTKTVYSFVKKWLSSNQPYSVRFAIVTLLNYFLGENFNEEVLTLAKNACCDHYYVNMAIAWLFSVALVKNYDKTINIIEEQCLPKFVHNKSIQKAIESFRISPDEKEYLRTLKI